VEPGSCSTPSNAKLRGLDHRRIRRGLSRCHPTTSGNLIQANYIGRYALPGRSLDGTPLTGNNEALAVRQLGGRDRGLRDEYDGRRRPRPRTTTVIAGNDAQGVVSSGSEGGKS